jgi:hypothetical protein
MAKHEPFRRKLALAPVIEEHERLLSESYKQDSNREC